MTNRELKNIIFDFDGTIADTSQLILATIRKTIKELGLPSRNEGQCKATIGTRLEEVPLILWPDGEVSADEYAKAYRANFEVLKQSIPIGLFQGVPETLSRLKDMGARMAIATSRSHRSAHDLLEGFGLIDLFNIVIGGDDVINGKPNPEPVNRILSEESWQPQLTLTVGDMAVDILMGLNAGTLTCGVTYGNGSEASLRNAGSDFIINNFSELINIWK